jgi:hypothetical protein
MVFAKMSTTLSASLAFNQNCVSILLVISALLHSAISAICASLKVHPKDCILWSAVNQAIQRKVNHSAA